MNCPHGLDYKTTYCRTSPITIPKNNYERQCTNLMRNKENFFIPTRLWKWKGQSAPKHRHIKFRHQGITQKKAYNIQNTAEVWNQEQKNYLFHRLFDSSFIISFYVLKQTTLCCYCCCCCCWWWWWWHIYSMLTCTNSNSIHTNTTPKHYTFLYYYFSMTCFSSSFNHLQVVDTNT